MAQKHNISGTVTNAGGASQPFTGTIEIVEAPVISGVTVVPQSAPSGTLRTITVVAHDPQDLALTYECTVNGAPAAAVAGQPGVFTVTA
jgi:hypothetical protein